MSEQPTASEQAGAAVRELAPVVAAGAAAGFLAFVLVVAVTDNAAVGGAASVAALVVATEVQLYRLTEADQ